MFCDTMFWCGLAGINMIKAKHALETLVLNSIVCTCMQCFLSKRQFVFVDKKIYLFAYELYLGDDFCSRIFWDFAIVLILSNYYKRMAPKLAKWLPNSISFRPIKPH